jgi:hypothetical protein
MVNHYCDFGSIYKILDECTLTGVGGSGTMAHNIFQTAHEPIYSEGIFFVVLWLSKWSQKTKETLLSWTLPSALPMKSLIIWNRSIIKYIFSCPSFNFGQGQKYVTYGIYITRARLHVPICHKTKKASQKSL